MAHLTRTLSLVVAASAAAFTFAGCSSENVSTHHASVTTLAVEQGEFMCIPLEPDDTAPYRQSIKRWLDEQVVQSGAPQLRQGIAFPSGSDTAVEAERIISSAQGLDEKPGSMLLITLEEGTGVPLRCQ